MKYNIGILSSKINEDADLGDILRCMVEISYVSSEMGFELVNGINIDNFLSKIKKVSDILLIEHLMLNRSYINEEFRSKLVKSCNKTSLKNTPKQH